MCGVCVRGVSHREAIGCVCVCVCHFRSCVETFVKDLNKLRPTLSAAFGLGAAFLRSPKFMAIAGRTLMHRSDALFDGRI